MLWSLGSSWSWKISNSKPISLSVKKKKWDKRTFVRQLFELNIIIIMFIKCEAYYLAHSWYSEIQFLFLSMCVFGLFNWKSRQWDFCWIAWLGESQISSKILKILWEGEVFVQLFWSKIHTTKILARLELEINY